MYASERFFKKVNTSRNSGNVPKITFSERFREMKKQADKVYQKEEERENRKRDYYSR